MALITNEYLGYVLDRLDPVGQITARAMFGGHGIYHRGAIFGLVAFDRLYFKVGPGNRTEYKTAGCSPFIYPGKHKPVTMSYWSVPDYVLEDDKLLKQWALAAHKVSLDKKPTEKKKQG